MPEWATMIGAIAALVLAVGVIWSKLVKPGITLVYLLGQLLPLVEELVEHFKDAPEAFETLAGIAREFKPNNGKSLRDVINRLEEGMKELREAKE